MTIQVPYVRLSHLSFAGDILPHLKHILSHLPPQTISEILKGVPVYDPTNLLLNPCIIDVSEGPPDDNTVYVFFTYANCIVTKLSLPPATPSQECPFSALFTPPSQRYPEEGGG